MVQLSAWGVVCVSNRQPLLASLLPSYSRGVSEVKEAHRRLAARHSPVQRTRGRPGIQFLVSHFPFRAGNQNQALNVLSTCSNTEPHLRPLTSQSRLNASWGLKSPGHSPSLVRLTKSKEKSPTNGGTWPLSFHPSKVSCQQVSLLMHRSVYSVGSLGR